MDNSRLPLAHEIEEQILPPRRKKQRKSKIIADAHDPYQQQDSGPFALGPDIASNLDNSNIINVNDVNDRRLDEPMTNIKYPLEDLEERDKVE